MLPKQTINAKKHISFDTIESSLYFVKYIYSAYEFLKVETMNGKSRAVNLRVCTFLIAFLVTSSQVSATKTEIAYLSGKGKDDTVQWEFFCTGGRNSGNWTTIPVPSNCELQGFGNYNYGTEKNKSNEQGKYRKRFNVPASWQDKRIFIVFEGVMTDTEVFVNGQSAGPKHQGGFYRFKYEITNLVKAGENLLEVTVSKVSANPSVEDAERVSDYWVFGGIYRPVYLQIVPQEFIDWTAIDAKADGTLSIVAYLNGIHTADTFKTEIVGLNGQKLCEAFKTKLQQEQQSITLTTAVSGHRLWTAETPNLYEAQITLLKEDKAIHTVVERFGFRTFEVRHGDGLYLNGTKIRLKGVNRHSFWPDSGRTLSRQISYDDVRLIKQMNMNAVRMSHYPPDVHFLDACDELGLYVLDELAGWQKPPYDTEVGRKLVKEMVSRDVSHPCILFWDNGNEGGWNKELDNDFALYDPQKRVVLHPWENFNGIDTDHYESYESVKKKLSGSTIFMPTELLHGLYDGGLGAGLDDYWNLMYPSRLGAGIFLWALLDEGVVRTDKNGQIDVVGNKAPDGILGPYRQKEGSFYAIKEIWSPVYVGLEKLPEDFEGKVTVENRYDFTNLSDCTFEIKLGEIPSPLQQAKEERFSFRKHINSPNIEPHNSGYIDLRLPDNWRQADVLYLTANDPQGREIWTWSWDIHKADYYNHKFVRTEGPESASVKVIPSEDELRVETGKLALRFEKNSGQLKDVTVGGKNISFGGGPRLIGGTTNISKTSWSQDSNAVLIRTEYEGDMNYAIWRIFPTGWLSLDYQFELNGQFNLFGVSFDYLESKMQKMRWFGSGPYRVWKNRIKGGRMGVWNNNYKNDIPGQTWDFPEFKGYYRDWQWVVFSTTEGDIIIINGTDDLFLGVYRPNNGRDPINTKLDIPDSGIAFLHGIPPMGDKFLKPQELGSQGQKNTTSGKYKGTVYFHFGP